MLGRPSRCHNRRTARSSGSSAAGVENGAANADERGLPPVGPPNDPISTRSWPSNPRTVPAARITPHMGDPEVRPRERVAPKAQGSDVIDARAPRRARRSVKIDRLEANFAIFRPAQRLVSGAFPCRRTPKLCQRFAVRGRFLSSGVGASHYAIQTFDPTHGGSPAVARSSSSTGPVTVERSSRGSLRYAGSCMVFAQYPECAADLILDAHEFA